MRGGAERLNSRPHHMAATNGFIVKNILVLILMLLGFLFRIVFQLFLIIICTERMWIGKIKHLTWRRGYEDFGDFGYVG